jgi:hypothetical protein
MSPARASDPLDADACAPPDAKGRDGPGIVPGRASMDRGAIDDDEISSAAGAAAAIASIRRSECVER